MNQRSWSELTMNPITAADFLLKMFYWHTCQLFLSASCLLHVFFFLLFHFIFIPPPPHTLNQTYWYYCICTSLQNKGMLIMNDGVERGSGKTQAKNRTDCTSYIQKVNACFYVKLWDPEQNSDGWRPQIFDMFWLWIIAWLKLNERKEKRAEMVVHGL